MEDIQESMHYGFSLYPFALLAFVGLFISGSGTTLVQSAVSGMQSSVVLIVTLATQAVGTVIAAAGALGALHRVLEDAG